MSQHYTKNTVEAAAWCNTCNKSTAHAVSDGRLSYCVPCFSKLGSAAMVKREAPAVQDSLFGVVKEADQ